MEKISSPKKIEIQYTARKSSQWLSVDITDDGYIYIHWIYVASEDIEVATQMIVSQFERILIKIFE